MGYAGRNGFETELSGAYAPGRQSNGVTASATVDRLKPEQRT